MSDVYQIAASGMTAQRTQMDLIAENLSNAGIVRADGSVFHPKVAVLQSGMPFESLLRDASLQASQNGFSFDDASETEDWPSIDDAGASEAAGVTLARVDEQARAQYRFEPGNPYAAKSGTHKGYVALPDVDPIEQMVALVASGRAYDADVSMLQTAKQMDLEASDISRV